MTVSAPTQANASEASPGHANSSQANVSEASFSEAGPGQALTTGSFSIEEVRAIAQIAREFDLAEIELCRLGGESLRMRRGPHAGGTDPHPPAGREPRSLPVSASESDASSQRPAARDGQKAPEPKDLVYVTSPFVGTFYRSAGPEQAAYVEPGQRVRKGQALCIIEAMKLMNELEAEVDGVVVACLKDNGRPVEYGERLFSIQAG